MDKQQELTKKIRNAINNTLGKEDITIEEGINAMLSACTQILYMAVLLHIKKTER